MPDADRVAITWAKEMTVSLGTAAVWIIHSLHSLFHTRLDIQLGYGGRKTSRRSRTLESFLQLYYWMVNINIVFFLNIFFISLTLSQLPGKDKVYKTTL